MPVPVKVLCVDDNPDAAQSTGRMLQLAGCDVRVCHDGPTALSVAQEFCPDVCVIDLVMPGMAGDELADQLRSQAAGGPSPRCIALTAWWDVDSHHRTHNAGFDEHVVKPVEPKRLIDLVTRSPH